MQKYGAELHGPGEYVPFVGRLVDTGSLTAVKNKLEGAQTVSLARIHWIQVGKVAEKGEVMLPIGRVDGNLHGGHWGRRKRIGGDAGRGPEMAMALWC